MSASKRDDPGGFSKKSAGKEIQRGQRREIAKGERAAAKSKDPQAGWFGRGRGGKR